MVNLLPVLDPSGKTTFINQEDPSLKNAKLIRKGYEYSLAVDANDGTGSIDCIANNTAGLVSDLTCDANSNDSLISSACTAQTVVLTQEEAQARFEALVA
ncbi:MAG: hypothetical protein K9M03_02825 [Kiritimatiellales bacterium]|nr:hypothetical protein [Kiritimatiellales bacterium]